MFCCSTEILSFNDSNSFSASKHNVSAWFLISIFLRFSWSAVAYFSASANIVSISVSSKFEAPWIVTDCSTPVSTSLALTDNKPSTSISKVTSIWGTPRSAFGIPSKRKFPKLLFPLTNSRSPCKIWISTFVWLSTAVENISDFLTGIVVFRAIIFVITPPKVSTPNDNGVTSNNKISLISPARIPAWIAAPIATTSSGFTDWFGFFPVNDSTKFWIAGIRVEPPTNTTSLISDFSNLASAKDFSTGIRQRWIKSWHKFSNFSRVKSVSICLGPVLSAVINGKWIVVFSTVDNSIFAFSAASVNRCKAWISSVKLIPSFSLKSFTNQSTNTLSKSSPPKLVSPAVDNTSKIPSPTSKIETSNVPPPKSKTRIVSFCFLSKPYASDAAVGSLIILNTSIPAIFPASIVAWRCESLK